MSQTGNHHHHSCRLVLIAVLLPIAAGVPAPVPAEAGEYGDDGIIAGRPLASRADGQVPDVTGIDTAGWRYGLAISRRQLCNHERRSQWCELFLERYVLRTGKAGSTAYAGTDAFMAATHASAA